MVRRVQRAIVARARARVCVCVCTKVGQAEKAGGTGMKENERDRENSLVFANTQISKGTRLCDVAVGMSDGALRRRMQIQIEHDKLLLSSHPVFRTSL